MGPEVGIAEGARKAPSSPAPCVPKADSDVLAKREARAQKRRACEGGNRSSTKNNNVTNAAQAPGPPSSGTPGGIASSAVPSEAKAANVKVAKAAAPKEDVSIADPLELSVAPKAKPKGKRANARRRKKRKAHLRRQAEQAKDPEVAAKYLQLWAEQQEGGKSGGAWKFNKATQVWLLHNAYNSTKVPKGVFSLLLRYLEGLQGTARERAHAEAKAIVLLRGAPVTLLPQTLTPDGCKNKKREQAAEDAQANTPVTEEPDAEELKARKLRLHRAKRICATLGGDEDEVQEDQARV